MYVMFSESNLYRSVTHRGECSTSLFTPSRCGKGKMGEAVAAMYHDPPKFSIQSSLGSPKHLRMRSRRLPDPRPIPEGVRGPICIHKK